MIRPLANNRGQEGGEGGGVTLYNAIFTLQTATPRAKRGLGDDRNIKIYPFLF